MAISEIYELDGVTVGTTELSIVSGTTSLATDTNDGEYQLWIDAGTMAKGDEFVIKGYEKVEGTGGTKKLFAQWSLQGVQSENFVTPIFMLMNGWDFTITKLAGTDRAFDASIRRISYVADTGTSFTAIPWNAAWDAEVQSECADALAAIGATSAQNVIGVVPDSGSTTLVAYLNETRTFTITTVDSDGAAVDLSALTLQVVIEDVQSGTDIQVIANAAITKTSTTISFATALATNDVAGVNYRWACRRTDTNEVKMQGPYQVKVAADD